jgi:hypothetical protein
VSGQRDPVRIAIRCDVCHRRRGHAPLLAEAARDAAGSWTVGIAIKVGGRNQQTRRTPGAPPRRATAGRAFYLKDASPEGTFPAVQQLIRRTRSARILFAALAPGQLAQLACSECPHRPRERWERLVGLAEDADSAGRGDAYA